MGGGQYSDDFFVAGHWSAKHLGPVILDTYVGRETYVRLVLFGANCSVGLFLGLIIYVLAFHFRKESTPGSDILDED